MSIEVLGSQPYENIPQQRHSESKLISMIELEHQQQAQKLEEAAKEEEDEDHEAVRKDSGLVVLQNRYYTQEESDNKPPQTTAVILKKVIKKPPPLYIDIKKSNNSDLDLFQPQNNSDLDLFQPQNNSNILQQNIPLKSPSTSIRLMDLGPLDTDEQHELEEDIKARRLARRQQKKTYADDDEDEEEENLHQLTIGTRVAEGHRNYQMMYDMLTGIRIAVGRVSAKMKRKLTPEDFTAAHKLVFDV
jgi:hypothetical protein